jgi:hypothetical protein
MESVCWFIVTLSDKKIEVLESKFSLNTDKAGKFPPVLMN